MKSFMAMAVALATALAAATGAGPALSATWTIELRGSAPLVCHADLAQAAVAGGGGVISLGPLEELCNDANGFHVYANTPVGTGGAFLVDGRSVPVSSSGRTEIDGSTSALIATRQLAYDPQGGQAPQSLTITVVAN